MATRLKNLKLKVPTYFAHLLPDLVAKEILPEFGDPQVPVLIHEAEGVRIVLGSHDAADCSVPDVQIERQPAGWVIFLHPEAGGDCAGCVYFYDDGRCVFQHDWAKHAMEILEYEEHVPEFDPPLSSVKTA